MLRKGCGKMAMDNSSARTTEEESEHPPLSSCSQKTLIKNRKSGQLICYKTGQVYLLLTGELTIINHKTISCFYILIGYKITSNFYSAG